MQNSNKNKTIPTHPINHWGPYILYTKIDDVFAKLLLDKGAKLDEHKDASKKLASHIDRVRNYDRGDWCTMPLIPYVNAWIDGWNDFSGSSYSPKNAELSGMWINYQESGEFNPEHIHGNADLSFVIYLKVPEIIKNEYEKHKKNPSNTGFPPGCINFSYGEYNKLSISTRFQLPKKNTIYMWPSYLRHGVMPFNSTKSERISVAGNIKLLD